MVRRIPRGKVATYGQIAILAGLPGQARLVGYAMSALDDASRVPWHRVVNAAGGALFAAGAARGVPVGLVAGGEHAAGLGLCQCGRSG